MVNSFAAGVHRVHPDNIVVAGALFPFTINRASARLDRPVPVHARGAVPLREAEDRSPNCGPPLQLDVWSHHPYTSGGPTHRACQPDSDLARRHAADEEAPERRRSRAGGSSRRAPVPFWVTEFGWDTAPADPKGVPLALHARWVSEALYRIVERGRQPGRLVPAARRARRTGRSSRACGSAATGGIACDAAEAASLQAFRFPFVAFRSGSGACACGAGPRTASPGEVVIERSAGKGKWRKLRTLKADSDGMFRRSHQGRRARAVCARRIAVPGEESVPFSLKRPPDQPVQPLRFDRRRRRYIRSDVSHDPAQQRQGRRERARAGPERGAAHPRDRRGDALASASTGEIEFLFMDGRSEDRTKAILEEMAADDRRIRVLDNPQRRTTFGLNIGLENARGDYVVRMDAHTEYPPEYVAKGVERLAARRRRVGDRPADPARQRHVVAARRDRAHVLARCRRLQQVGGRGGEGHRHRRLHGRVAALDPRRVRRLGRRLARQPGLGAGRAVLRAGQPHRVRARAGRALHAARLAEVARASSTGATASTGPRRAATTRRACAARRCSRPPS